jgi:hypothetical protein
MFYYYALLRSGKSPSAARRQRNMALDIKIEVIK